MKRLRFCFFAMSLWFFVLYNIERYHGPINISSFVYVLTAAISLFIMVPSLFHRLALRWLLVLPLPLFFFLKVWFGYQIGGAKLPITITEICVIGLTIVLVRLAASTLEEFQETIITSIVGHMKRRSHSFDTGQAEIYREIRRARLYRRPLTLMTLCAAQESVKVSMDHFTQEVLHKAVDQYITARIADLLSEELKDCDTITQRNSHFVVLLPETNWKSASALAQDLEAAARKKLGIRVKIGLASFPDQEVTFEKLLERSEGTMWNHTGPESPDFALQQTESAVTSSSS